jgi:ATP synthase protein I
LFHTRKDKDSETYRIIGVIGSFGFTAAGSMAAGYFLGSYLDRKFNTSPWIMLILIMLGITGSFIEFFRLIKKLFAENKKDHDGKG